MKPLEVIAATPFFSFRDWFLVPMPVTQKRLWGLHSAYFPKSETLIHVTVVKTASCCMIGS